MLPQRTTADYAHDLVISAVSYDALLVADLAARLAPRLRTVPLWAGHSPHELADDRAVLSADSSRLVLVLHQRMWQRDGMTQLDDAVLRERVQEHPESVRVVALDHSAMPEWASSENPCELSVAGVDGVVEMVLDSLAELGGACKATARAPETAPPARPHWPEGPAPFLAQPRAFSALRRAFDSIGTECGARMHADDGQADDRLVELHSLPNRLIARVGDVAISFSWVAGRMGTVGDGRLLVIQWSGVAGEVRGRGALKSATPARESIYHPESSGADQWAWRVDEVNGRAYSTSDMVAEWFASASMTAPAMPPMAAVAAV